MANPKVNQPHPVLWRRAEEHGYQIEPLDALGGAPAQTGRSPAGVVLRNADGDAVWIDSADLAACGDLLIRAHVALGRQAVK
jgi:hypothetical protein